jgi:phosphoribosylformimino-5-aminoimidazole carboxamide ribotide isomerase
MTIIPAIDLKDGQCVRLRQGLMEDTTVFSDNPVDMAAQWVEQGARRLHLVDLNGAFEGKPMNADSVMAITQAFPAQPSIATKPSFASKPTITLPANSLHNSVTNYTLW